MKDFKLENDDSQLNLNHIVKLNDLTYKSMLKDKINTKIMQNCPSPFNSLDRNCQVEFVDHLMIDAKFNKPFGATLYFKH